MKKIFLVLLPIMAVLTILNFNNDDFSFWYILDNLSKVEFRDISGVLSDIVAEFNEIPRFDTLDGLVENFSRIFDGHFEMSEIGAFFSSFGKFFLECFRFCYDFILFLFDLIVILVRFVVSCMQNILILFNSIMP